MSSLVSNLKWVWQAHFLSHTYETQEICCFLADVQIILVSLFEFFDSMKIAKNAGAFLSRCSELFDLADLMEILATSPGGWDKFLFLIISHRNHEKNQTF